MNIHLARRTMLLIGLLLTVIPIDAAVAQNLVDMRLLRTELATPSDPEISPGSNSS